MTDRKPAKIKASRRIRACARTALLRVRPKIGEIDRSPSPYWRNAGSDQR